VNVGKNRNSHEFPKSSQERDSHVFYP
jgi:hypothetical protein